MNPERIYVYPPFKRMIKERAAQSGKSIIEWTKEFMKPSNPFHSLVEKKDEKKKFFDYP